MKTLSKNRIGFKFSWEANTESEKSEILDAPLTLINTLETEDKSAHTELANRIEAIKKYMVSTAFRKMKKAERINTLETYEFYNSLYLEYTLIKS